LKKRIYVAKDNGQTYAYLSDDLKKIEVDVKDGEAPTKVLLDTDEKVMAFMPGATIYDVEFLDDVLGKHDAKVQRLLAKPRAEDEVEYVGLHQNLKTRFISDQRAIRFDAVVISVVVTDFNGNPLTEADIDEMPIVLRDLLSRICNTKFGGDHSAFFENAWSRQDN
jgi:hypothetical protein